MSTDSSGDDAPKLRSFADAAALLPSLVPFPGINPAAPPTPDIDAAELGVPAAMLPHGLDPVTFGTLTTPITKPVSPFGRRAWVFALAPVAAAGLFAAWYGRRKPGLAAPSAAEQAATPEPSAPIASAPVEAMPTSGARPEPERDAGSQDPRTPAAAPSGTAAVPDAGSTSMAYNMIVLHPRPPSAKGDAANARITALLQPLTARLEVQKKADTQGRLTVHYFHAEDAAAAQTLADMVRTPGARVKIQGPVRTQKAWPSGSFEVWLRGP